MPITHLQVAHDALDDLQNIARDHAARRAQVQQQLAADTTRTDEYKTQALADWTRQAADQAKRQAADAVSRYQDAIAYTHQDLQHAAADAAKRIDYQRAAVLRDDYAAQLANPPGVPTPGQDPTIAHAQVLLRRAENTGDPTTTMAARIAITQALSGRDRLEGTDSLHARDLLNRAHQLADTERGDAPRLEAELDAITAMGDQVRSAVLRAEQAITGETANPMFGEVTDWARDVLGDTIEDYGGGVHLTKLTTE